MVSLLRISSNVHPAYPCTLTSPVDNMLSASKIFIVLLCLSACTGGNSIAIARVLSPPTSGQVIVWLLLIRSNGLHTYQSSGSSVG